MNTDLTVIYATNPKPEALDVGLGINRRNSRFANCIKEEETLSCINHLSVGITSDHFDFLHLDLCLTDSFFQGS